MVHNIGMLFILRTNNNILVIHSVNINKIKRVRKKNTIAKKKITVFHYFSAKMLFFIKSEFYHKQ